MNRDNGCCRDRIVGATIMLSSQPCESTTCTSDTWTDTFTSTQSVYTFSAVSAGADPNLKLMSLRVGDEPSRPEEKKFQVNSKWQTEISDIFPTTTDWTYLSVRFTAGFKDGAPITDAPTHNIQLAWYTAKGDVQQNSLVGSIYMDDISIQLADGHAGATRRHCHHNLNLMGKKITLQGDTKENTIIDCGREGSVRTHVADRGFIFVSNEGRETVVERLTGRNCRSSSYSNSGGGYMDDWRHAGAQANVGQFAANMFGSAVILRNAGPTLRDLQLVGNRATYGGSIPKTRTFT